RALSLSQPLYRWGDLGLFLIVGLFACGNLLATLEEVRTGEALAAFHHLVVGVALGINAALVALRGPAIARGEGVVPKVIAIVGSSLIPVLSVFPIRWDAGWLLAGATGAIIL